MPGQNRALKGNVTETTQKGQLPNLKSFTWNKSEQNEQTPHGHMKRKVNKINLYCLLFLNITFGIE